MSGSAQSLKTYRLTGADGRCFASTDKGRFGGHRKSRIFGRLDCRSAARHLSNGTYQKNRVFFADAATAIAAGYRACKICQPPLG
jgi:methylphosphotriester-DNA--protein-cysteine methyltransferase